MRFLHALPWTGISYLPRTTLIGTISPRISAIRIGLRQFTQLSPQGQVQRDTSYPYPMYFHPIPSSANAFASATAASALGSTHALAFQSNPIKDARQVLGFVTIKSENQTLEVKPLGFFENEAFNQVLHTVIQQHLVDDPDVQMVLQQQSEGWTHIADLRNPAPYGRIPLPEDIFGSVQIREGAIRGETYQRMPSHRIVSSNGLFQLSEHLHRKLVQYLQSL